MKTWRQVLVCGVTLTLLGCTHMVGGVARPPPGQQSGPVTPDDVDVVQIMLDTARMRGITGAGEDLTIIPTMDATAPVDIEPLAGTVPAKCRFIYAETAVFGPETTQFHKITFQHPAKGALISEGIAVYPDGDSARRTFDALVGTVSGCANSPAGAILVGEWDAGPMSLQTRSGRCGSDYRIKAVTLLEVTFCGFPGSVADIVLTNLAANIPG